MLIPEAVIPHPLWFECPPICTATWLPAHETKKDAQKWGEGTIVYDTFECSACGGWHNLSSAMPPSGYSDGGGREYVHKPRPKQAI